MSQIKLGPYLKQFLDVSVHLNQQVKIILKILYFSLKIGMAAAACAAAAAVQRAQILIQAKNCVNGESAVETPETQNGGDGASKDLKNKELADDLSSGNEAKADDVNDDGATPELSVGAAEQRGRENTNEGSKDSSLVESSSKEPQVHSADLSNAAPLLKEIIQGKLALAAAATLAHRNNTEMDLAAAQNYARHNNNDLKENKEAFLSQLLKMRQEMALNMSMNREAIESKSEDEEEILEEEEEELPIDLQRTASEDGNSVHSQTSPRTPSSDAGMSTSSAVQDKASRLEHIVSSMQRASPTLPKEGDKPQNNPQVNGCKKRKLYQPVQTKTGSEEEDNAKKQCKNDENTDPENRSKTPQQPQNVVQMHYMEMARKFLQDQQDKATKEAITKEILADTVGRNNDIAEKLVSISPELKGLADLLKSEITASLAIIIDSIVGRFLQATRNNNAPMPRPGPLKPGFADGPTPLLPPMPSLKTNSTPSGRAPQVRDRAAPRSTGLNPVSMYNPLAPKIPPVTTSSMAFPLPPTLRPAPGLLQPSINNNNSEDEATSPSPNLSPPEQDEALSLVVTPKKRRHKVTDTRITPRTLSRVLGEPLAELHKQFPHLAGLKENTEGNRGPMPGGVPPSHPLFPGLPAPPGLLAGLPTSVAIPNPSLADFNPFSSFYSPPHLPVSSAATPPTGAVRDNKPKFTSATPPLEKIAAASSAGSRERHHSSSDIGRSSHEDSMATPPSFLRHPSLLARGSPDFAARLRDDREREQEEFERMGPMSFMSPGKTLISLSFLFMVT